MQVKSLLSGKKVTLSKQPDLYSPKIDLVAELDGVKFPIWKMFVTKDKYKGIQSASQVYVKGRVTSIFIPLSDEDVVLVEKLFTEVEKEEEERKAHWMELNIGICLNSDYSCHYWRGDDRTSLETIIREGKEVLRCCWKNEKEMEHIIKKEYEKYFNEKKMARGREKEKEAREEEAFAKARKTQERQFIEKYFDNCNDPDEECDTDIIYVFAMPDGTKKYIREHTF